ncbi:MAG: hypothetical protein QF464_10385, partial [Myxococcota bacterium]|nr:hypothetical protein [Myxococcota bacterium]
MPKGIPNFEDIATEVIDALTAGGWEHTGTARAGFWSVTQMGQGKDLVDVFTPAGQRQDRVWLSPAKGGKRAEKRALGALEAGGFKAAERRQKGLRIVRARGRRNAPTRPRRPTWGDTVKIIGGVHSGSKGVVTEPSGNGWVVHLTRIHPGDRAGRPGQEVRVKAFKCLAAIKAGSALDDDGAARPSAEHSASHTASPPPSQGAKRPA